MLKKGVIIITCFCLIFCLGTVVQASNEKAVGRITALKGEVLIFHKDETKGIQAKVKDVVYQYDTIQTMKESRVQILMEDDSIINLSENAKIHLKEYIHVPEEDRRSAALDLLSGKGRFIVAKLFAGRDSKFQVNTSTSVTGVRDTHFIVWVVSPELTTVITIDGTVIAKNILETLICESVVGKNYSCQVASNKCPTAPALVPAEEMEQILMDTHISPAPPEGETAAAEKDAEDMAKAGTEEKVEVPGAGTAAGIFTISGGTGGPPPVPPIPQSPSDRPGSLGNPILPPPPGTPK